MLLLLLLVVPLLLGDERLQEGGEHRGGRHLACVEVGLDEGVLRHEEKEERSGSGGVGLPASCAAQSRQPRAPVRHWYSGDAFACTFASFLPSPKRRASVRGRPVVALPDEFASAEDATAPREGCRGVIF